MELKANVKLHNRFDIEVRDLDGELKQTAQAENIVLDSMWTRLCNFSTYFVNIHYGSGTGALSALRTSLFTHTGTATATTEEIIKGVPNTSWKRKIVLAPETAVGVNITEVGIAYGSSSSNLVTHAMLKDSEGNQISIEKTNTDVVTIYATVYITITNSIEELSLVGLPNSNYLINYLTGSAFSASGFQLLEIPSGEVVLGSVSPSWSADIPNKKRKTNVARFGINVGNGNVTALSLLNMFELKLPATGIFSGQPYEDVPIGVGDGNTKTFKIPSANVKAGTVSVKINGASDSTFTMESLQQLACKIKTPALPPSSYGYGVSLTADGKIMAVAHDGSPFISTYDWVEDAWIKRNNPTSPPSSYGRGVSLTSDGKVMAVAHDGSPYVSTYDWVENAWIKRDNPTSPPTGTGRGVSLTSDGNVMAVSHYVSPYVSTYDWVENAWIKRDNPTSPPSSYATGVSLTADGKVMAVSHDGSPFISTYDWVENAWIKRNNPTSLPNATGYGVALTPDGNVMAVVYNNYPYIATYKNMPMTYIKATTIPASGEIITANYTVNGLHKTDQYVVDVSCAIQFGE